MICFKIKLYAEKPNILVVEHIFIITHLISNYE